MYVRSATLGMTTEEMLKEFNQLRAAEGLPLLTHMDTFESTAQAAPSGQIQSVSASSLSWLLLAGAAIAAYYAFGT